MLSKVKSNNSSYNDKLISSFVELIIAKHRNGPTGTIRLKFNKEQMTFSDLTNL